MLFGNDDDYDDDRNGESEQCVNWNEKVDLKRKRAKNKSSFIKADQSNQH